MFFVGSVKILLILYPECCALIHFPANLRALVATSVEIEELASKMRELLASQIDQQIHMRMFLEILVGGRQSLSLKRVNKAKLVFEESQHFFEFVFRSYVDYTVKENRFPNFYRKWAGEECMHCCFFVLTFSA